MHSKTTKILAVIVIFLLGIFGGVAMMKKNNTVSQTEINAQVKQTPGQQAENTQRNLEVDDEPLVYETEVEGEEDCSSYEQYDSERQVCFFECRDEQECASIEAQIDDELSQWSEELDETGGKEENDNISDKNTLASYRIDTGEKATLVSGEDTEKYRNIWAAIAALSPDALSDAYINKYELYDDDQSDVLAFVSNEGNDKWVVVINLGVYDQVGLREKQSTLIHELAHIVSLNASQLTVNENCPTLQLDEGCMNTNSHLQTFWTRFWKGTSNPAYEEDKFVSEYATTNVVEDFAETFAFFVLGKDQTELGNTIKEQKIKGFFSSPEMVTIRKNMRSELARNIVREKKLHPTTDSQ